MLLYQPDEGYRYNSDSIFLYGFASRFAPKGKMLDIGAGCGIVGLLIARDFSSVMLEAVEKQPVYAEFARRNAQVNRIGYTLHEGDVLDLPLHGTFDWIVSNPPFYHEGADRSSHPMLHQARYNVHLPIDAFARKLAKLLRSHGEAAICYDARQFVQLCGALEGAGLRVVEVQFVYSKEDRPSHLVMVHAKKSSRSLTQVLPPLIMFDMQGNYTAQTAKIYEKAKAHSITCPIS